MKLAAAAVALAVVVGVESLPGQAVQPDPVIDMHLHGPSHFAQAIPPIDDWIETFEKFNIQKVVLAAWPEFLAAWADRAPGLFIPSLMFPCMPLLPRNCFPGGAALPDLDWLRSELQAGRVQMFGEIASQLVGMFPNDPALEPYFALAAEFDIPFGLHMGMVPPAFPDFDIAAGNPLALQNVLRRHPNLRLFVMHAGWPMGDEMVAILWHYPNVYVEIGYLQTGLARAEYYSYLQRLVTAGFSDRIMFGSDAHGGFAAIEEGIQAILDADFLSPEQKRDILYNNAARFLRLSDEEVARHHGDGR